MSLFLLTTRLFMASVFIFAGVSKLRDRAGSRSAIAAFGAPVWAAGPLAIILMAAELCVAALLCITRTAWLGSLASMSLLVLFTAVVTANLAIGRRPDCHCFGQIAPAPIGWVTVARNIFLVSLAIILAVYGRNDPGTLRSFLVIAQVHPLLFASCLIGALVFVLQGWIALSLLRQQGRLLLRIEALETRNSGDNPLPKVEQPQPSPGSIGLPIGAPAPDFLLPSLDGEAVGLSELRRRHKPVLLVFSDPDCGPCSALLPEIARWQRDHADKVTTVLVSRGTEKANRAKLKEHDITYVLLQKDREIAELYQANGTPAAVVVQPGGGIRSRVAMGSQSIRALVAHVTESPASMSTVKRNDQPTGASLFAPSRGLAIGTELPDIWVKDLDGAAVSLDSLIGKKAKTLLLFWNPQCGFCNRMLSDLKEWEHSQTEGTPQLLVISTGAFEANRAIGFQSTILIDETFSTATKFQASGTPSAVLIDDHGKILSELGVGAPAVLALVGAFQKKQTAAAVA